MWLTIRPYVPTSFTIARALAAYPIYVFATMGWMFTAFAVALLASATDKLDGDLARKWKCESEFGAYCDVAADKALVGTMLYLVVTIKEPNKPLFWAIMVCAVYHTLTVSLRFFGAILRTSNVAKVRMFVEMSALNAYLCSFAFPSHGWIEWVARFGIGVIVVLTIWSAFTYVGFIRDIPDPRPTIKLLAVKTLALFGLARA
jgi:CDP-diacylglycerol--glycerol-3-phosphate 3-phosphatidyltransferase